MIVLASLQDQSIKFQLGLDFEKDDNDIVIIDEADSVIFSDPEGFRSFAL